MTNKTMITGFPRIGEHRELKIALEKYWSNKISLKELESLALELRKKQGANPGALRGQSRSIAEPSQNRYISIQRKNGKAYATQKRAA